MRSFLLSAGSSVAIPVPLKDPTVDGKVFDEATASVAVFATLDVVLAS